MVLNFSLPLKEDNLRDDKKEWSSENYKKKLQQCNCMTAILKITAGNFTVRLEIPLGNIQYHATFQ